MQLQHTYPDHHPYISPLTHTCTHTHSHIAHTHTLIDSHTHTKPNCDIILKQHTHPLSLSHTHTQTPGSTATTIVSLAARWMLSSPARPTCSSTSASEDAPHTPRPSGGRSRNVIGQNRLLRDKNWHSLLVFA